MASNQRSTTPAGSRERSYFEQQREALIGEIAMSFEHVLANINKLNRSLEAVTAVGNEFSSVEALWSQFESVMAKDPEAAAAAAAAAASTSEAEGQGPGQGQQQDRGEGEGDEGEAGKS